eukprot:3973108-Pyramimonas_sp.AAC.1
MRSPQTAPQDGVVRHALDFLGPFQVREASRPGIGVARKDLDLSLAVKAHDLGGAGAASVAVGRDPIRRTAARRCGRERTGTPGQTSTGG